MKKERILRSGKKIEREKRTIKKIKVSARNGHQSVRVVGRQQASKHVPFSGITVKNGKRVLKDDILLQ